MPTYEGLRLKVLKYNRKLFGNLHQKKLENKEFTIISNNCWGGTVYEYYNLPKQSPTVGCFFMAEDYVRFVSDLRSYLESDLTFISSEESKWRSYWIDDSNFGSYPIGVLKSGKDTVEIFFLHYHSEQEAREKWTRRCGRIHWDKLLVKFNDQNHCGEEDVQNFLHAQAANKCFFTCRDWNMDFSGSGVFSKYVKQPKCHKTIMASYEPFGKEITQLLNSLK